MVIMRRMMLATALTALTASLTFAAPAAIIYVPSPIFMDHMVLQREKAVPVWGVGSPVGGQVTVTFAGQVKTTGNVVGATTSGWPADRAASRSWCTGSSAPTATANSRIFSSETS